MKRRHGLRFITARLTLFFAWLLERLPLGAARFFARMAGRCAYHVARGPRRTGFRNLDLVYGNTLSRREKAGYLRQAFENVALIAAEFPRIPRLRGEFLERHVEVRGLERLPANRGAIFVGGHLGNWEWVAPALASRGVKMAEVVRPLSDPGLNAFVDQTRRSTGVETIGKDGAVKGVIEHLREGYSVGIAVDQSPSDNGVPVRFLGHDCWGTVGPVVLSRKTGAPILGLSMERVAGGRYVVEILPEVELVAGDPIDTMVENCQRCQDVVEGLVRRNPGQWLWLHRRWKDRPRLAREWAERQARHRAGSGPSS